MRVTLVAALYFALWWSGVYRRDFGFEGWGVSGPNWSVIWTPTNSLRFFLVGKTRAAGLSPPPLTGCVHWQDEGGDALTRHEVCSFLRPVAFRAELATTHSNETVSCQPKPRSPSLCRRRMECYLVMLHLSWSTIGTKTKSPVAVYLMLLAGGQRT